MAQYSKIASVENYNTLEYNTISIFLPPEYVNKNINEIPNHIRAQAWINAIKSANTTEAANAIKDIFSEIWNFRQSKSGFTADSDIAKNIMNLAYASSGSSNYFNQLQPFLYGLDRYNSLRIPDNLEFSGPMFMSRPRLCMQTSNLRNHRGMAALDTDDPNSVAFMIRALLDTNLCANNNNYNESYKSSSLFDYRNPFLTPLCNAASAVNGLPDLLLETATTQGGFMAEAQQFAVGGDNLHRGAYEINITFKDVQYGPVTAILYYWIEYIRCVTRGHMLAYADDIDQQRLNYTVSIYMFNLDPSRKYITKWCKCTGCFPRALPFGAMMNREYNGARVKSSSEVSVPFVCNVVEYMDPSILMDFNSLVRRYYPDINKNKKNEYMEPDDYGRNSNHKHTPAPHLPILNFTSLPYITSDPIGMRLEWRLLWHAVQDNQIDLSVLEMLQENQVFTNGNKSIMEQINNYYYPGFSRGGKEFNYVEFADFIKKTIEGNK